MDRDITILRLVAITGAQWGRAERLLDKAQRAGYLIEVPSKTGVAIGWPITDNQTHTGDTPAVIE